MGRAMTRVEESRREIAVVCQGESNASGTVIAILLRLCVPNVKHCGVSRFRHSIRPFQIRPRTLCQIRVLERHLATHKVWFCCGCIPPFPRRTICTSRCWPRRKCTILRPKRSSSHADTAYSSHIKDVVKTYAQEHSSASRILSRGWIQSSTGGVALARMLDDLDHRPIYIDSFNLHSMWCNSAALDEMGITDSADLPGGAIHRDENGKPSGLLDESAGSTSRGLS